MSVETAPDPVPAGASVAPVQKESSSAAAAGAAGADVATLLSGTTATPANETSTTPASETITAPASGTTTAPASGTTATPASGTTATPLSPLFYAVLDDMQEDQTERLRREAGARMSQQRRSLEDASIVLRDSARLRVLVKALRPLRDPLSTAEPNPKADEGPAASHPPPAASAADDLARRLDAPSPASPLPRVRSPNPDTLSTRRSNTPSTRRSDAPPARRSHTPSGLPQDARHVDPLRRTSKATPTPTPTPTLSRRMQLHTAAAGGRIERMQKLIQAGYDVNAACDDGESLSLSPPLSFGARPAAHRMSQAV